MLHLLLMVVGQQLMQTLDAPDCIPSYPQERSRWCVQGTACMAGLGSTASGTGIGAEALLLPILELVDCIVLLEANIVHAGNSPLQDTCITCLIALKQTSLSECNFSDSVPKRGTVINIRA